MRNENQKKLGIPHIPVSKEQQLAVQVRKIIKIVFLAECGIIFLIFAITLFIFVFTCPIWFKLLITRVKHMGHEHQTAVQRVHSTRPFPPPPYYDNQTLPSYDNVMQST